MPTPLLDVQLIQDTLVRLRGRIEERFPGSGLGRVAGDLIAIGDSTARLTTFLARPNWPIRFAVWAVIITIGAVLVTLLATLRLPTGIDGIASAVQTAESLINDLIFLGLTVFFLMSLEDRLKRRRALESLHRLRSIAHIVDMHQLTKDPVRVSSPAADTASSPKRSLTTLELARYLDYCSEMLSVTGKLAALHAQHFNDSVTLGAVNEIENLCAAMSNKIWQKITMIERARA